MIISHTLGLRCPHCSNLDTSHFRTNGVDTGHEDCTILCSAPVKPEDSADEETYRLEPALLRERRDANGCVPCGMQWNPWEDYLISTTCRALWPGEAGRFADSARPPGTSPDDWYAQAAERADEMASEAMRFTRAQSWEAYIVMDECLDYLMGAD